MEGDWREIEESDEAGGEEKDAGRGDKYGDVKGSRSGEEEKEEENGEEGKDGQGR